MGQLAAFVPVALLLTLAPGPATALVVRNAVRGGRRRALLTTAGNSAGVFLWGGFAALGIAAVVASLANPKLAVFYVALFPQFVPDGKPVLPSALAMAAMVVAFDLVWYSVLAYMVARVRRAF